ncbi:MAG: hypothetical protein N2749_00735 [Clostridia bacterium]|nr:hypothetical protein [Clostridia bacterium]
MLYEKNGVITEERFKKMTVAQWIFHYIEIMKHKKEDISVLNDLLKYNIRTISEDIDLLGVVINSEGGKSMIEIKRKFREDQDQNQDKAKDNKNSKNTNDVVSNTNEILNDTDKELLDFFNSVPETMAPTKEQINIDKYCLPTVDVKEKMKLGFEIEDTLIEKITVLNNDIAELESLQQKHNSEIIASNDFEVVDSLSDDEKPHLGF